jgi:hypothetical protein
MWSVLAGFAASQSLVTGLLQQKILGYDLYAAGSSLKVFGDVRPSTSDADEALSTVRLGLKLKNV